MDKASEVLAENVNRVPTLLDRETARLMALFEERTTNIRSLIADRDDQSKQDKASAATAVETALTSLKELIFLQNSATAAAIAKSESATSNDLESLSRVIGTTKDGITNDITNLKQRMDRSEGAYTGQKDLRKDDHMTVSSVVGVCGAIVGLIALVIAGIGVYPHAVPPAGPVVVGAEPKRIDDLIARMDALSARINALTPRPSQPPP